METAGVPDRGHRPGESGAGPARRGVVRFYPIHLLVIPALELVFGYHPQWDTGRAAALTALTFTVSLTLARLLHIGVEKPARRLLISAGSSR